ncbi:hemin-degrading factor [Hoeflea prorocentri]|uniref:Hemin-degrading factor n=1 Tax=Hoeflea prorocentri TaxID=1922333 RepID=A0A9X3ZG91_9HYPH|nr:ChuX/HutX family heme-like substrate-binding protein [Hoeflea prorocentri]MCY6379678.1 hemin-degrading factor [Hoeflea prorocentri]MDA5397478.1 hemin-degrading factor [Hoeflea prorocentri]
MAQMTTADSGPESIRQACLDNPKMRERDLALKLGVSEADIIASWCGQRSTRLEMRINNILNGLESLGEVMALTRNESAVHEKIGVYDGVRTSDRGAIVLGEDIDLRIKGAAWVHGFAVEKHAAENTTRSLQFFDAYGDAVHKIHLRPNSDLKAFNRLVAQLKGDDQNEVLRIKPRPQTGSRPRVVHDADLADMRNRWAAMKDVHQFAGILRRLNLTRHQAVSAIDDEFAWQLHKSALLAALNICVTEDIPIMCFVASPGVVQIHSGPIHQIKQMGPWLNILDPGFHLHLRADHIDELWAVRKPNKDGHVTSLEAYNGNGDLIIQFFGVRREGADERNDWRLVMENLPKRAVDPSAISNAVA